MPNSTRSGSATTSCADSAIIDHQHQVQPPEPPQAAQRRPDARCAAPGTGSTPASARSAAPPPPRRAGTSPARLSAISGSAKPTTPLAKPPGRQRQRRAHRRRRAVVRDKSFQSRHLPPRPASWQASRRDGNANKVAARRAAPAAILRAIDPPRFALASTQPQHSIPRRTTDAKGRADDRSRPRPRARDAAPRRPRRARRRRRRGRRRARRRRPRRASPPRVSSGGRVSNAALEADQFAAHGLAWMATYAEALRELAAWAAALDAAGRLGETERADPADRLRRVPRPARRRHPDVADRDRPPATTSASTPPPSPPSAPPRSRR